MNSTTAIWPLALYFGLVIILVAAMIGLSYILGQRHRDRHTGEPYESGIVSTGSAHVRLSQKFYLVAMFFVVFDLESVFIFAWAVSLKDLQKAGLGWVSYGELLVFVGILVAALVYLWRLGALDWGPKPRFLGGRKKGES